jgi:hypothetical protein
LEYNVVIKELEALYFEFKNKFDRITESNRYHKDDVRLAYYILSFQDIDSAIHLLMFNTKLFSDQKSITPFYSEFGTKNRFERLANQELINRRLNNYQFIANQYSISIFSKFEYCVRLVIRGYKKKDYIKYGQSITKLFYYCVCEFRNQSKFFKQLDPEIFEYITTIRNTIHNNGVYMPLTKNEIDKTVYDLDDKPFTFQYGKLLVIDDPWTVHFKMTKKLLSIFDELIKVPEIDLIEYIYDLST